MKAVVIIVCCVLAPDLAALAVQDPAPAPEGKPATDLEASVALPFTADKVWFRTAKVRLLGLSWESIGELKVTEGSLEFTHKKGTLRISRESIHSVSEETLAPDMANTWVVVRYAEDGKELVAAFTTPPFSGAKRESLHAAIRAMAAAAGRAGGQPKGLLGTMEGERYLHVSRAFRVRATSARRSAWHLFGPG